MTLRERDSRILERESVAEISREKIREKKREKSSPAKPILIQPRYTHVLRIAADTNQPSTRAPTRTPCGEAGSEDSWLRVAHAIQQKRANRFSYLFIDVSINCLIKLFDLVADF